MRAHPEPDPDPDPSPDPERAGGAVEVDARGLRCPLPVIRLAQAVRGLPAGTLVNVLATDPAAVHDVPAWARLRGHDWIGSAQVGEGFRLTVRLASSTRAG